MMQLRMGGSPYACRTVSGTAVKELGMASIVGAVNSPGWKEVVLFHRCYYTGKNVCLLFNRPRPCSVHGFFPWIRRLQRKILR